MKLLKKQLFKALFLEANIYISDSCILRYTDVAYGTKVSIKTDRWKTDSEPDNRQEHLNLAAGRSCSDSSDV